VLEAPGFQQTPTTTPCVHFPQGFIPFTTLYFNDNPPGYLWGLMTPAAFVKMQSLPLPTGLFNETTQLQGFCESVQLAPGYIFNAAIPTAQMRVGYFASISTQIINPITRRPYLDNIIPPSQFPTSAPGPWLWPINGISSGGNNDYMVKISLASAVSPSSASLAFGSQDVGLPSTPQTETVTNTGTDILTISAATIGGTNAGDFATSADTCTGATIALDGTCTINVTFTPSVVGNESASLIFTDNASGSPQAVSLTGTGAAPIAGISSSSLTFSSQNLRTTSSSQPITLSNSGNIALAITSIAVSANFAESDNCNGSVAANGSCTINVTFTPTVTGPLTGTLTITDNSNEVLGSMQTVNLSGTGTAPVVSLSTSSLTFGSQSLGTTSTAQPVTVYNTGGGTLTITGIAAGSNFGETDTCGVSGGGSVASGGSCTINVTFTPTAVGALTGTLTITDNNNGVAGSTQMVSLSGTGINTPPGTNVTVATTSGGTTAAATFSNVTTPGNTTIVPSVACASGPANFSVGTAGGAGTCVDVSTTAVFAGMITITVSFNPANYTNLAAVQLLHLVNGVWTNVTTSVNTTNDTVTGVVTSLSPFGVFQGLPALSLPATSPNFGSILVNSSSNAQQVTLTNSGAASLVISTAAVSGTNATDFAKSADTCSGATVPVNGTCSVTLTFKPTAGGTRTAALTLTDNAANSPQTVALTGTGEDFSFALASGSSTSATVAPGQTASYNFNVGSLGGLSGTVTFTCAGNPTETTCLVLPPTVTLGSSATPLTVAVTSTAASTGGSGFRPVPPGSPLSPGERGLLMLALLLAATAWAFARRSQPRASWWKSAMVPLAAALLLMLAMAGCAGGGGNPGTPAGTSTLTVTGTMGSGSSALSHSMTLTLTVS
jgi:hypothetical protein